MLSSSSSSSRPELALGLVAQHVPPLRAWRILVCREMVEEHSPNPCLSRSLSLSARAIRLWRRRLSLPRRPRPRVASFRSGRRLHRMDDPILVS